MVRIWTWQGARDRHQWTQSWKERSSVDRTGRWFLQYITYRIRLASANLRKLKVNDRIKSYFGRKKKNWLFDHEERENLKILKHVLNPNLDNSQGMEEGLVITPIGSRVRKPLSNVPVFIFLGRKLTDFSSSVKGNEQIVQIVNKVILLAITVLISLALCGGYQSFPRVPQDLWLKQGTLWRGVAWCIPLLPWEVLTFSIFTLCSNTRQLSDQIFSAKEK